MYFEKTLSNGITVVGQKLEAFRSATVGIWIRAGSVNETDTENGITHFIEHMLFKGTARRSAKDIAAEMDSLGGILNAFTSKECTCYHARVMDEHIDKAVDLLTDIVFCSTLDEAEIEKEKNVVKEEINMSEDSPEDLVFDLLASALFRGHNLERPILGTADTVSAFTRDDLKRYMDSRYTAGNIVVAAAGGFAFESLCDALEKAMESISIGRETSPPHVEHLAQKGSFVFKEKPIEQAHICLATPSVRMTDPLLYSVSVMNNAFGGSMSSRLFQKIREERGLAYDVYSQPAAYSKCGAFTIYTGVNPNRASEALEVILDEMGAMAKDGLTEEEFTRASDQLKGNYTLGLESTGARMNAIGKSRLLTGKVRTAEDTLADIQGVTQDSICEIMPIVFDRDHMSAAAVGKIEPKTLKKVLKM